MRHLPGGTATAARVLLAAAPAAFADGFGDRRFATADAARGAQPHWMTPVVTVTPRLEQEFRYDQSWQDRPHDVTLDTYGGGKGLELTRPSTAK
jgi:hypothetical protein